MKGEVEHKDKDKKGEIIDSDWLHGAKYRDNVIINYDNIVAVAWDDGGLGWINKKLLEKV